MCDGDAVEDCNGDCNGDAEVDECGDCGGSGADFECWNGDLVCDSSDCSNEPPETIEIEILYSSDADIAGFQFNMDGVTVLGASGGDAEASGFSAVSYTHLTLPTSDLV